MENDNFDYDEITDDMYDNTYKLPKEIEENEIYIWAKNQIDKEGYICELYDDYHKMKFSKDTDLYNMYFDDKYKVIKFYNAELYTAFAFGGFSLEAYKESTKIDIDNEITFFNCYKGAYIKGVKDFNNIKKEIVINGNQELFLFLKGWLKQCKYIFSKRDMINIYSMGENGRYAGIFSRIIEIITKNIILQQQIKDLASDDLVLQQRIEKIISNYRPLQPITIYDENDTFFNADEETKQENKFIEDKNSNDTGKTKHTYNALLSKKYDAKKVYECFFKGKIAVCSIDCFNDWFVNGYISDKIIPTLKGRQDKIAVAQIRCFIETITENPETLKDGYYNNVFDLKLNNTKTAKNLSIKYEAELKLCEK